MKYRKDKRTKNLTLRDIHVGDWVQVWSEITDRYSPPLKIITICDDGTIYLVTSDEERPTPWEEDIKSVDALEITPELLQGFGFDVVQKDYPNDEYDIIYNGEKICKLWVCDNLCTLETPWNSYEYFHEFMGHLYYVLPKTLKLEWKGITVTSKTKHCGECKKFAYEDTDGYGFCLKTNMECRCSDKCHITHEKP